MTQLPIDRLYKIRDEQQRYTTTHQLARADPHYQALSLMALKYHPDTSCYTTNVGTLSVECAHYEALKFPGETDVLKVMSNWSHLTIFAQPTIFATPI